MGTRTLSKLQYNLQESSKATAIIEDDDEQASDVNSIRQRNIKQGFYTYYIVDDY